MAPEEIMEDKQFKINPEMADMILDGCSDPEKAEEKIKKPIKIG